MPTSNVWNHKYFRKFLFRKLKYIFKYVVSFFIMKILSLYMSVVKVCCKIIDGKVYLPYSYLSASTWCLAWCHSSNFSTPLHSKVTPLTKKHVSSLLTFFWSRSPFPWFPFIKSFKFFQIKIFQNMPLILQHYDIMILQLKTFSNIL